MTQLSSICAWATRTVRQQSFWTALKILLAVALLGLVLSRTSLADLAAFWSNIALPWLPASALAYLGVIWLTALRYWLLVDRRLSRSQALGITVIQTVVGNFVASSAGVVSYLAMLRGRHQVQLGQGLISVLLARFGDLLGLMVGLLCASLLVWPTVAPLHWLVVALLLLLGGVVLMLVLVYYFRQPAVALLERLIGLLRLDRLGFVRRGLTQLAALAAQPPQRLQRIAGPFLSLSLLLLLGNFIFSYTTQRMLGILIGPWELLFILVLVQLIAIIPIQVFGGLGVYEVTAIYLYGMMGVRHELLIPFVISSRIYLYLLNLLLLLYLPFESRFAPAEEARAIQES